MPAEVKEEPIENERSDKFEYELPTEDDFYENQENFHSDYQPKEKTLKKEKKSASKTTKLVKDKAKRKKKSEQKNGLICSFCSEEFKNLLDLRSHRKTVHVNVQCEVCDKIFETLPKLKKHQKTHKRKKKKCEICDKMISGKGFLTIALQKKTKDQAYEHTY